MHFFLHCPGPRFPHLPFPEYPLGPETVPSGGRGLLCPNASRVQAFTDAVAAGHLTWQAYPFAGQPEHIDGDLFAWGVTNLTHALDDQLRVPRKRVYSTRDVPGISRAAVPHLARAGVVGVSVGVNTGSSPPGVPGVLDSALKGGPLRAFVWRDEGSGTSVIAQWHGGGYAGFGGQNLYSQDMMGDCVVAEGLDEALCYSWMGDNMGPPATADIVRGHWQTLEAMFPNASVEASDMDAFWGKLARPAVRSKLEVSCSWGKPACPWSMAHCTVLPLIPK